MRHGIVVIVLLLCATAAHGQGKRRVYVLHSGMHIILAHPDKNRAAVDLKRELAARGVPKRDLIQIDSPFPEASLKDMVPRAGLVLYLDCVDPKSRASHDAYVRLHNVLKANGVTKNDDIIWIGHSAGGQVGMTMAHLAHNLGKYPELAKKTQAYHFDTLITLGTAFGANNTPADVKLRIYYSAGDTMIFFLSKHGNVMAESVKSKVKFRIQPEPAANVLTRVFYKLEHAEWCFDHRAIECILREAKAERAPWRKSHADSSLGLGLSQLIAEAMEVELRIALEEPGH